MSYRIPEGLAHVVVDRETGREDGPDVRVFLRRVPGGPTVALVETAARIWLAAAEGSADISATVAEQYGLPFDAVRLDVDKFLAELVGQEFLEQSP